MDERTQIRSLQREMEAMRQQLAAAEAQQQLIQPPAPTAHQAGSPGPEGVSEPKLLEVASLANQIMSKIFNTQDLSPQSKVALSGDVSQMLQVLLRKE